MNLAFVHNFTNAICSTLARRTKALHKANLAKELQSQAILFNIIQHFQKQKSKHRNIKIQTSRKIIQFCISQIECTFDKPPIGKFQTKILHNYPTKYLYKTKFIQ